MTETVLLGRWTNSKRHLHFPDPENPEDSLCRFDGDYTPKPRDVLHDDQPVCSFCQRKLEGETV